jgi:ribosomal protein L37AE/L43A
MHLVKEDMDTFQEVACEAYPAGSWMQRYFHGRFASISGSTSQRSAKLFTEARQAQVNRTGCGKNSPEQLDAGLWDHPMFDSQTCGAGGCYTPLGPWATSQLAAPVDPK